MMLAPALVREALISSEYLASKSRSITTMLLTTMKKSQTLWIDGVANDNERDPKKANRLAKITYHRLRYPQIGKWSESIPKKGLAAHGIDTYSRVRWYVFASAPRSSW